MTGADAAEAARGRRTGAVQTGVKALLVAAYLAFQLAAVYLALRLWVGAS